MASIPSFDSAVLGRICAVLGDTGSGLTGGEIGDLLGQLAINDPDPVNTKRIRLYNALKARQEQDRCGNLVVAFIHEAMIPVRYTNHRDLFEHRQQGLNKVLAFAGMVLGADGKVKPCEVATTLSEAEGRAGRLRAELSRRHVHDDVLRFCQAELLENNCFHAVLEATKSVADKIRSVTGLTSDGAELAIQAFAIGKAGVPLLAFNKLRTDTERSEHNGLMNLMKGMFGTFRNPAAHAPKVSWSVSDDDALDLLTMASFLHRRLDGAERTTRER